MKINRDMYYDPGDEFQDDEENESDYPESVCGATED